MSAHLPRFTVVTICRNALAGLRRTVETVLGQRYLALEYWIVDGASTDGTVEYLRGLDARRVSVLSEPDRGISDAMNKGLSLAIHYRQAENKPVARRQALQAARKLQGAIVLPGKEVINLLLAGAPNKGDAVAGG